jgi:hypothetical protein
MDKQQEKRIMREYLHLVQTDFGTIMTPDEELLVPRLEEIRKLVEQSRYSARIEYLLRTQELHYKKVPHMHSSDMRWESDRLKAPNCLGTIFYVTEKSQFNHPYHGWDDELKKFKKPELKTEPKKDTFCFSWTCTPNGSDDHGGLCIGKIAEIPIMFAQHGKAGYFGFESTKYFRNPEFYKIEN